jgi:anti-sigma factor RsiW
MKCPDQIIDFMHDYLDEDITPEHEKILREHLSQCERCQTYFNEIKKTIALVQSTSNIKAPDSFTENVMKRLPKEKRSVSYIRWFRNRPLFTAATLFVLLMVGSLVSGWTNQQEFSVTNYPNLVIKNHTVIVPKGETVNGDIVVRNGSIKIEGKVNGNVTVINGEPYMASAGQVAGEINKINQVFDWILYQMKRAAEETVEMFSQDKNNS